MKIGIINRLRIGMYGFGIFMGIVFPFYTKIFDTSNEVWNDKIFVIGSILAGLMIGLFCFQIVKVILLKEIRKINTFSNALGNNDLNAEINIDSNDEIGEIAQNLSKNMKDFKMIITKITETSTVLVSSLSEMNQFSSNMTHATDDIQIKANDMANMANYISENSTNITNSILTCATSIESSTDKSQQLTTALRNVNEKCLQEVELTNKVNEEFQSTYSAIETLANHSSEISEIANIITNIADQTNLLAINAAVEAAVAGQYGKSFAVVANEVKILADRSLKSAAEISKLIETIQPIIENSKVSMGTSSENMRILTDLAHNISAATQGGVSVLEKIDISLQESDELMKKAAVAVEDNNKGINESKSKLALVNDSIFAISDDIKRETENIRSLENEARDLEEVTSKFKL